MACFRSLDCLTPFLHLVQLMLRFAFLLLFFFSICSATDQCNGIRFGFVWGLLKRGLGGKVAGGVGLGTAAIMVSSLSRVMFLLCIYIPFISSWSICTPPRCATPVCLCSTYPRPSTSSSIGTATISRSLLCIELALPRSSLGALAD